MNNGIDPRVGFYLGILVTIQIAIGQGAVPLTNVFPVDWIPYVKGWSQFLGFIGSTVMTALFGYSGPTPGPLTKNIPPSIVKSLVLIAILLTSLLAFAQPSHAQKLTGNAIRDVRTALTPSTASSATSTSGFISKTMNDIAAVKAEIVAGVIADLEAADADAGAVNPVTQQPRDPVAHACYPALMQFLQSLPTAQSPAGNFVAIQLFQRKRDFILQLQGGLPAYLKIGCSALLGDEVQTFVKSMALVGVVVSTSGLGSIIPAGGVLSGLAF